MSNIRLQRETKRTQKDYADQIKKHAKIVDNFVCAPDPENLLHWYFVTWGLEGSFKGGYYFGQVICPSDFPQKAPKIKILVENGHFHKNSEICMSMTDMHPESWNPAWTVQQVILGLVSFWSDPESRDTSGAIYIAYNDNPNQKREINVLKAVLTSRQESLSHPKFEEVLGTFAPYIGINEEFDFSEAKERLKEVEKELK